MPPDGSNLKQPKSSFRGIFSDVWSDVRNLSSNCNSSQLEMRDNKLADKYILGHFFSEQKNVEKNKVKRENNKNKYFFLKIDNLKKYFFRIFLATSNALVWPLRTPFGVQSGFSVFRTCTFFAFEVGRWLYDYSSKPIVSGRIFFLYFKHPL